MQADLSDLTAWEGIIFKNCDNFEKSHYYFVTDVVCAVSLFLSTMAMSLTLCAFFYADLIFSVKLFSTLTL